MGRRRLLAILCVLSQLGCGAVLAEPWQTQAKRMVREALVGSGITHRGVLESAANTPRHEFVPRDQRRFAYYDMALPIGERQTISPPFIVAFMTERLDPQPTDRVLEIGTGSGYQAAILSPLVKDVYTIEIVEELGRRAAETLDRLGYENVHAKVGDGFQGWPEYAPFDKIIVTCSPEDVPQPLIDQLREGGRMIIPVGQRYQQTLFLMTKENGKLVQEALEPTLFVPMTGAAEEARDELPDPLNPRIVNGGFERLIGRPPAAAGWHYQRQLALIVDPRAPEGQRFARFRNEQPGRWCQALQGFALDGRQIASLEFSTWIRGEGIRQVSRDHAAKLLVLFYDKQRAEIRGDGIGPWEGTFPWRQVNRHIRVPVEAREAVVAIGLLGATGRLDVDGIELEIKRRSRPAN